MSTAIVLIEDEADIRMIAELSLSSIGGYATFSAESGEEGVQLVRQHRPDAVLVDMMMPGLDGLATLELIQSDPTIATIPVIFLSGRAGPADEEKYRAAGAAGVIAKPFDPMSLAGEVAAILDRLLTAGSAGDA